MYLHRFTNHKEYVELNIVEETKTVLVESTLNNIDRVSGTFDILNERMHAVLSYDQKNHLLLGGTLHQITQSTRITYFCAMDYKSSWFKIHEGEQLIYEIEYINPHKPYIDYFSGLEDWDPTNFADYIARRIDQVHENPEWILFQ